MKLTFDRFITALATGAALAAVVGALITIGANGCTAAQTEQGLGVAARLMRTVADVIDPINESLLTGCKQGTVLARELEISFETTASLIAVCSRAEVSVAEISEASKELKTAIGNNDVGAAAVASERLSKAMEAAGKVGAEAFAVLEQARQEMEAKVARQQI